MELFCVAGTWFSNFWVRLVRSFFKNKIQHRSEENLDEDFVACNKHLFEMCQGYFIPIVCAAGLLVLPTNTKNENIMLNLMIGIQIV